MDERRPTGILFVNTDVDAPHKREEYLRWYLDVHFRDVADPGIFTHPLMFRNAREPLPDGERPFLALYETAWEDVAAAALAFEAQVQGLFAEHRIHPGTVGGPFGIYRLHAFHFEGARRRAQSLLVLHLDAAAGRESELRDSGETLLRDAAALGVCHSASFLERIEGPAFASVQDSNSPRFLALLASDRGDPASLADRLSASLATDSLPDSARLRSVGCFRRHSP